MGILNELEQVVSHILVNEPMKNHTSFKIGGPADYLIEAETAEQVPEIIAILRRHDVPYMIMGNGSNLLVRDKGIRGAVVKISGLTSACAAEGNTIRAEAGILLSRLSSIALKHELAGLEFASGIPGTLGGGIFMNAGAYGGELKNVVRKVTYVDETGDLKTACTDELKFGYRRSMFTGRQCVILSAELELVPGHYEDIRVLIADYTKRRTEKQPLSMPSAGSVFKRPAGHFAGGLIEAAGLKCYTIGGAMVSGKHAGFIVNKGDAAAQDVIDLIAFIQKTVEEKFSVHLEPEIKIIGE